MTTKLYTVGKAVKEIELRTGIPVSKTTIYRQAALGRLPGVRHNGRVYINVDEYCRGVEEIKDAVARKLDQFSREEVEAYLGAA